MAIVPKATSNSNSSFQSASPGKLQVVVSLLNLGTVFPAVQTTDNWNFVGVPLFIVSFVELFCFRTPLCFICAVFDTLTMTSVASSDI